MTECEIGGTTGYVYAVTYTQHAHRYNMYK